METTPSKAQFRRSRFRLSVRGLIFVVMLIGGGLGWFAHCARVQRIAVATIEAAGGDVGYSWVGIGGDMNVGSPVAGRWKRWVEALGIDYVGNATRVRFRTGETKKLTDDVLAAIGRLPFLEEVSIGSPTKQEVTDAGFAHLRRLSRLKTLSIVFHAGPGIDLSVVGGLTGLEELQLAFFTVTDADLAHFSNLTRLKSLEICINPSTEDAKTRSITDEGMAALEPLRRLETLQLDGTRVTTKGLVHLRGMDRLSSLSLVGTRVTSLEPLRHLVGLKSLSLDRSKLTDDGLATVGDLHRLESLNLQATPVGDPGLAHLSNLGRLKSLVLVGTRVTPEGLKRSARPGLRVSP